MKEAEIIDNKILQTADILAQIKSVDEMIELHQGKGDSKDIMLIQYQYRRGKFLKELSQLLSELNIAPTDLAA